jgi:hypothetical protein
MELPLYKLTIDEEGEGVDYVALTDMPAIERNFQAFSQKQRFKESAKRVISGALMLADVPIYRNDPKMGEYMVVFDRDTIYKIVQKFFKQGATHNVNAYHRDPIDGVYMFESYLIDRERGIDPPKGFEDVTDGSWFGSYKVDNDAVWEEFVTTGKFKGFSVEGMFGMEKVEDAIEVEMQRLEKAIDNFLHTFKSINI